MSDVSVDASGLGRRFRLVVLGFGVSLASVAIGATALGRAPAAVTWAVPTAATLVVELWILRRHLDSNHPAGAPDQRYDSLGTANVVTLGRGGIVAAVAGFALLEPVGWVAWLPPLLYAVGSALDWVDGYLARTADRTTVLGERLDMAIDSLGFVVAPLVAVAWGRLPVWYLSLSAARYIYTAGKARRQRRGLPVDDLPASLVRRPLAGLQMTFIAVALVPLVPSTTVHAVAPFVLMPSLLVFLRDYLVVAGHLARRNNN